MSDENKPERKKVADPEIKALATVDEALAGLPEGAQHRVLVWVVSKYAPPGMSFSKQDVTPAADVDALR